MRQSGDGSEDRKDGETIRQERWHQEKKAGEYRGANVERNVPKENKQEGGRRGENYRSFDKLETNSNALCRGRVKVYWILREI